MVNDPNPDQIRLATIKAFNRIERKKVDEIRSLILALTQNTQGDMNSAMRLLRGLITKIKTLKIPNLEKNHPLIFEIPIALSRSLQEERGPNQIQIRFDPRLLQRLLIEVNTLLKELG